jgi:hypothetical protein
MRHCPTPNPSPEGEGLERAIAAKIWYESRFRGFADASVRRRHNFGLGRYSLRCERDISKNSASFAVQPGGLIDEAQFLDVADPRS